MSGAYACAAIDSNFRKFLRQLRRAAGTYTIPGFHFEFSNALQGAPDAGFRWEQHSDQRMTSFGWSRPHSEPGAIFITKARPIPAVLPHRLLSCLQQLFHAALLGPPVASAGMEYHSPDTCAAAHGHRGFNHSLCRWSDYHPQRPQTHPVPHDYLWAEGLPPLARTTSQGPRHVVSSQ